MRAQLLEAEEMAQHVSLDWFGNGQFCARCMHLAIELALQDVEQKELLEHHLYWRASPSYRKYGRLAHGLPVEGRPPFLYPSDGK
jgi:hypothetical protein